MISISTHCSPAFHHVPPPPRHHQNQRVAQLRRRESSESSRRRLPDLRAREPEKLPPGFKIRPIIPTGQAVIETSRGQQLGLWSGPTGPRVVGVDVADVARKFPIETGRVVFQRPLTATRSREGGSGLLNQRPVLRARPKRWVCLNRPSRPCAQNLPYSRDHRDSRVELTSAYLLLWW